MDKAFDVEKIKSYYEELLKAKEEAVRVALLDKAKVVQERFELEKERIAEEVELELIENAEAPYKHDIELCEKFVVEEEPTMEETEEVGE